MQNIAPIIDLPADGELDTEQLAQNMTEEEFRALVILTFRYVKEIVGFTRTLQGMLDGFMSNPMAGLAMMQGMQSSHEEENPAIKRLRASGLVGLDGR